MLHPDRQVVEQGRKEIEKLLSVMGLKWKPSKTRITQTHRGALYAKHRGVENPGFDFFSFKVRQYTIGKYQQKRKKLEFKTLIKPSPESVKRHLLQLKRLIYKTKDTGSLIRRLGPVIRGWSNYQRHVVSSRIFSHTARQLMTKLMAWARRKHRLRTKTWIYSKYLRRLEGRLRLGYTGTASTTMDERWVFLKDHTDVTVERHVKVRGDRSPYDGDWIYWGTRGRKTVGGTPALRLLLQRQKGRCAICRLFFKPTDIMEMDHIKPQRRGGLRRMHNLQLLHGHCHQAKHARL